MNVCSGQGQSYSSVTSIVTLQSRTVRGVRLAPSGSTTGSPLGKQESPAANGMVTLCSEPLETISMEFK